MCEACELCGKSAGSEELIAKETPEEVHKEEEDVLTGEEATRYRPFSAVANDLSQDRCDIQYVAKEICLDMAKPRPRSWINLKKFARYLLEVPNFVNIQGG